MAVQGKPASAAANGQSRIAIFATVQEAVMAVIDEYETLC